MTHFYEAVLDHIEGPKAWYADNNAFLPHFHESIELVYVLAGTSHAIVDGEHLQARPGDIIINSSYQVHAYIRQESQVIVAAIPLAAVPSLSELLVTGRFRMPLYHEDGDGRIGQMMKLLVSLQGCHSAQCGMSTAILGYLIDRVGLSNADYAPGNDLPRRILSYLGEHYDQQVTSSQLAAHFGYSRSRLSHLFKSSIGYSLPEYLHMVRLRRVAGLLATTSLPVSQIAAQCGYGNMHTFHYAFREHYGITPGQYRRGGEQ